VDGKREMDGTKEPERLDDGHTADYGTDGLSVAMPQSSSDSSGSASLGALDSRAIPAEAQPDSKALLREERRSLRGRIINLALPALIEQTLMTLVSMADMIMVGRLGPWAITSVGLSNQPMFVAMSVFISINVGATALVARFIGAKQPEEASRVARQSLVLATSMGVVLAIAGFFFARDILLWMGAEPDVVGPGTGYLKTVSLGLVFMAATISLSAVLRGAGDTKTPMTVNIVANLVNVAGNWLLIFGHLGFPRLEVTGAAVATSVSRGVACVLIFAKVFRGHAVIKMSRHDSFRPDFSMIKRIFRVGIPAAMEQLVMRSGQMTFARIVSSFGTVVYAAHQVALNIEGLSFTPGMAFQIASTSLVGRSLGAKEPDKAERYGWEAVRIGVVFAVVAGLVFFFLGRYVSLLYTNDPVVETLSAAALKIIAVAQPFMITTFVLSGGLRGAGDTKWTLYITMAGIWGVRVVAAYLFAIKLGMGLQGAWIGMALDMTARAVLVVLRFRAGHWKSIKV